MSFDTYCTHLAKSVNSWCHSHHIERDKSIFLDAKFFEDIVALCVNPGGPVAQYQSAAQGMLMLACRLLTAVEAEYRQEYWEGATHTWHTCSIDDLIKWNQGKTVSLAVNYMELKLNIGTYCSLLWSILGDHCNYYKELLKLYRNLNCKECFTIHATYTPEVCARITWSIVDDGCSFFG
jgi:hypothetical protein